jgi:hypothetical protein
MLLKKYSTICYLESRYYFHSIKIELKTKAKL